MDPKVASYSHHYLMYQCDEGVLEAELTKSNLTIDDVKADFCYVNNYVTREYSFSNRRKN